LNVLPFVAALKHEIQRYSRTLGSSLRRVANMESVLT